MKDTTRVALKALQAWRWPVAVTPVPNPAGLINETFWVVAGRQTLAVLQHLNTDIFVPEVHEDIDAVTRRLASRGVLTPRLIPTVAGTLWHTDNEGSVWRCLTFVGDRTRHKLSQTCHARSAGSLVARFHGALHGMSWEFRCVRSNIHDTEAHMRHLVEALDAHRDHRLYPQVAALASQILAGGQACPATASQPRRIVHGDLKISNIRFAGDSALAIIDLDTLGWGTLDVELGDAMRSWCNTAAEDSPETTFDLDIFEAAMRGYLEGCSGAYHPTEAEWNGLVPGIERVCWELASRFAYDALEESYFGFDPRFGGRGEHNLMRARGQAALAMAVRAASDDAWQALKRAWDATAS